jgi:hypothetical protein
MTKRGLPEVKLPVGNPVGSRRFPAQLQRVRHLAGASVKRHGIAVTTGL